jgi:hypothetical protein
MFSGRNANRFFERSIERRGRFVSLPCANRENSHRNCINYQLCSENGTESGPPTGYKSRVSDASGIGLFVFSRTGCPRLAWIGLFGHVRTNIVQTIESRLVGPAPECGNEFSLLPRPIIPARHIGGNKGGYPSCAVMERTLNDCESALEAH